MSGEQKVMLFLVEVLMFFNVVDEMMIILWFGL